MSLFDSFRLRQFCTPLFGLFLLAPGFVRLNKIVHGSLVVESVLSQIAEIFNIYLSIAIRIYDWYQRNLPQIVVAETSKPPGGEVEC